MAKPALEADGLVITYNKGKPNEFNALKNICVQIFPREYIILFGPSGCGKSTLLYTMLGGVPPAGGHMYVRGEDIYAYTPAEMNAYQQTTIGIVYQAFNLLMSISVLDNVALPRLFLGQPPSERNARASILLRLSWLPLSPQPRYIRLCRLRGHPKCGPRCSPLPTRLLCNTRPQAR